MDLEEQVAADHRDLINDKYLELGQLQPQCVELLLRQGMEGGL